jgi:exodeoxyribonuclease VII large subunit
LLERSNLNNPISVSELNTQIKGLLETSFSHIYVEGEISNLTYHNSGHIYFSIKDEKSTISCVMFRGNAAYLKFQLEVGMKIVITGNLTVYTPRGNYQLLCTKIEPSGVGSLAIAYEQLKKKLEAKGYFDPSIKKPLPSFPDHLYIITSNTGAAIEDMKKIAAHRWPLIKITLLPTLVQGEGSKESIVKNIKLVDTLCQNDKKPLLIVGRGGGSIEDLWSFNEEIVADAIYEAKIPIISAVGHESDFVISDFVADKRASTPSNAIEISLPDINEQMMLCSELENNFIQKFKTILFQKEQILSHMKKSFQQHSLESKFMFMSQQISNMKEQFNQSLQQVLKIKQSNVDLLKQNFISNDPSKKNFGYQAQVSKDGKLIPLENVEVDDCISLQNNQVNIEAKIIKKELLK